MSITKVSPSVREMIKQIEDEVREVCKNEFVGKPVAPEILREISQKRYQEAINQFLKEYPMEMIKVSGRIK